MNVMDTTTDKYKTILRIIENHRGAFKDWEWDKIDSFDTSSKEDLAEKLEDLSSMNGIPIITAEEWHWAVKNEKQNDELGKANKEEMDEIRL